MSDSDREFEGFPRLEFWPNPPLGTGALPDSQVTLIEFGYDFILLTQRNGHQTTIKLNPELFDQPSNRQLGYLFLIIQKDYKELCNYLLEPSVRSDLQKWMDKGKTWLAENRKKIEKARQLEEERLKNELQNANPKTVRDVIKCNINDRVIVRGIISQRSLPVSVTRKDTEYTAYNFKLLDLDDPTHRIPVNNLPVDGYDNGDLIAIQGIITQTLKRGKAFKEIDGLDFRIEERKSIPSDPLERVWRPLIFDFYESKCPNYVPLKDAIAEICDKNPEASKIMDPRNRRKFTMKETNPKRLNRICCDRRPSDCGYLEKGTKKTPLNYRWVKKVEDEDKAEDKA